MNILVTILSCALTAVVGGIVSLFFFRIKKKIDQMEKRGEQRTREEAEMRKREQELLLANATLNLVLAKKSRGVDVNGDLAEAENDLRIKQSAVQEFTRGLALSYMAEE